MFASARQAEIIRSNQKDVYYLSLIKSAVADITQRLCGPRAWLRWRRELDVAGDLGYFLVTTVAGFQTLGEEYVNIVQVDSTLRAIPSLLRRASLILLQVAAPYALDRALSEVEKRLRVDNDSSLTPEARTAILGAIPVLRHTLTLVHRCHLALFYLRGVFYHISKRLTSTRYILVRSAGDAPRSGYSVLGWLSLVQLSVAVLQHAYKWSVQRRAAADPLTQAGGLHTPDTRGKLLSASDPDSATDRALKCVLCLETRSASTLTPCGHLFCWACITEWCSNKPECPLCREGFQMSRLVRLQNYDPS